VSLFRTLHTAALVLLLSAPSGALRGEDRSFDGTGNNLMHPTLGVAGAQVERIQYQPAYANSFGAMLTDHQRPNARALSNALSAQSGRMPNARGLSDYLWIWGQFLDHDMSLSTSSHGATVNGSYAIATGAGDPLGPNPINFTRSNFIIDGARQQINEVTSFIDGSQVYGSDGDRASALRAAGGKLLTSANNLLPYNTGGWTNQNQGATPASQLFLAGDIRANENLALTSMQTVFMREHNRLVDKIAVQQPGLNDEQRYQLARKLVGAEIQAITYREFLPALLGGAAPTAQAYSYSPGEVASVTNSFAHSAFRFGHSTLPDSVVRADASGVAMGSLTLGSISSNPNLLTNNPNLLNELLRGAATQAAEEVDLKIANSVRTIMFGPPGAGGTDLAALDIQRGRDHGLPDYNELRFSYDLSDFSSFSQIPATSAVRNALQSAYGDIDNIDSFIGGLAETHLAGSSVGPLFSKILAEQFERTRDGDRLFYRSNAAGLYTGGALNPSIASLVNLNTIRLSDIIELNTNLTSLQDDVFFAELPGDFNGDRAVDGLDLAYWESDFGAGGGNCDADNDGDVDGADFLIWQRQIFSGASNVAALGAVPEPASFGLAVVAAWGAAARRRRPQNCRGNREIPSGHW
jgi:hypothetical protein